jgi:hypothetical protein
MNQADNFRKLEKLRLMGKHGGSFCYNFNAGYSVDSTSILIFQFNESYNWIVIQGCNVGITVYLYVIQSNGMEQRDSKVRRREKHQMNCYLS